MGAALEAELREVLTRPVAQNTCRKNFWNGSTSTIFQAGPNVDVVALVHQGHEERTRAILEAIDEHR